MGKLRIVPKAQEPGFIKIGFDESVVVSQLATSKEEPRNSISIKTRRGTTINVQPEMSLKQIARFIKMIEGRPTRGLG